MIQSKKEQTFLPDAGLLLYILCWNSKRSYKQVFPFHISTNASLKTKQKKKPKSTEIWLKEEIP